MIALASRAERRIEAAIRESRKKWLLGFSATQEDIKALHLETYLEIRRILSFYADPDDQITSLNIDRLMKDITRPIEGLGRERNRKIELGIIAAVLAGIDSYKQPLDLAGIGTSELAAVADGVRHKTIAGIHNFTYSDGLELSDRLWNLDLGAKQKVERVIRSGVALGEGSRVSAQRLIRGGIPIPKELLKKMGLNTSAKIGSDIFQLFTPKGRGNIVHNALRVTRTELGKANREAFLNTGKGMNSVIGHRWHLSASHPRPDICDVYATRDPDGLGPGGYKKGNYPALPAHPEDLCFDTPIFGFEGSLN